MDLSTLSASDGTGEATQASVTAIRTAGATTITVSSFSHWPAKFIATTGTLITIPGTTNQKTIDPTTMLVFAGHKSGSTLVIDTIAPGYTDHGNVVNDVVILKPTTYWADTVQGALQVSHNNDGTLKTGIVTSGKLAASAVNTAAIAASAVTSAKLAPSRTTDANGWTVYDFGSFKMYSLQVSYVSVVVPGSGGRIQIATINGPSSVSDFGSLHISAAMDCDFSAHITVGLESGTATTRRLFIGNIYDGSGSLTSTGRVMLTAFGAA